MKWTKELLEKCHNPLGQAFWFLDAETREAMESVKDIAPFDAVTYNGEWYDVSLRYLFTKTGIYRINPSWLPDELKPRKLTVADLPDGYDFGAVDADGSAYAYGWGRPICGSVVWDYEDARSGVRIKGEWDASDWRNSLIERKAYKPDDWREEYTRYPVEVGIVSGWYGVYLPQGFACLTATNALPGAWFEWGDDDFDPYFDRPRITYDGNKRPSDPRKITYIYPVAVWLPKGASK